MRKRGVRLTRDSRRSRQVDLTRVEDVRSKKARH